MIAQLQTLSESEQEAIALMNLEEIEDEKRWDEAFSRSSNVLAKLAAIALTEYHAGKTQELDPETLICLVLKVFGLTYKLTRPCSRLR